MEWNNTDKSLMIKVAIGAILGLGFLAIVMDGYYVVEPGITAIQIRAGSIHAVQKEGGWYLKMPLVDRVVQMPNGIIMTNIETDALSKDLQAIRIGINVNYSYINEIELFKATRGDVEKLILVPFCHESIKSVLSKYTAEQLILNRHDAKDQIYEDLKRRLRPHYIEFIEVNFAHADFSPAFIAAVEEKQIALQQSMMARNITEQVRENAIQTKLKADAEAYGQQVKKQSLTKELIMLKAIEKWDGRLPQYTTGVVPFLNVKE